MRRHLALGSGRREFDLARLRNGRRRDTGTSNGGDNTGAGDGARHKSRRESIGFDVGHGVFGRDVGDGSRQAERLAEIAETDQVGRAFGVDLRDPLGAVGETAEEETVRRITGDWFDHTQRCGRQVIELIGVSRSARRRLSAELKHMDIGHECLGCGGWSRDSLAPERSQNHQQGGQSHQHVEA